jgi:hypothetical protein
MQSMESSHGFELRRVLRWAVRLAFLAGLSVLLAFGLTACGGNRGAPGSNDAVGGAAVHASELGWMPEISADEWLGLAEGSSSLEEPAPGLQVDNLHRETSAAFFHEQYVSCEGVSIGWTGSHAACAPGTTSEAYRAALVKRINYYRAMAGIPASIEFSTELNARAQQAAVMLSVNGHLSHQADPEWTCFTSDAALALRRSNLFLGVYSCQAIDGYMEDPGSTNFSLPHRRWLLNPRVKQMGSGDVPPVLDWQAANVLWVMGPMSASRPLVRDSFVAWPPPGYVPYQVIFPRWSFSYPWADFSAARVSMTFQDAVIELVQLPLAGGYAENTVAWEPQIAWDPPVKDRWYTVHVDDVLIRGQSTDFTYVVIIFDPDRPYEP